MLTIQVSNELVLEENQLPEPLKERIEKDLTFLNPEYQQKLQHGGRRTPTVPKYLYMFRQENGQMILPRGYIETLISAIKAINLPYQVIDQTLLLPSVQTKSDIPLRDYQEKAVQALLQQTQGGLVSPCGSGKTIMMLEIASRLGQPAIWITNSKDLADDVRKRACQFYGFQKKGDWDDW